MRGSHSYPNFFDVRAQNTVFEQIASYTSGDYIMTGPRRTGAIARRSRDRGSLSPPRRGADAGPHISSGRRQAIDHACGRFSVTQLFQKTFQLRPVGDEPGDHARRHQLYRRRRDAAGFRVSDSERAGRIMDHASPVMLPETHPSQPSVAHTSCE